MELKAKKVFAGIKTNEAYEVGATNKGISIKTILLLLLAITSGISFVTMITNGVISAENAIVLVIVFAILAVISGFVGQIFASTSAICGMIYAISEGAILGLISFIFNAEWGGIVVSAVLVTASIFVAMLLVYVTGLIKVTSRFTRFMAGIFIAGALFFLVYFIMTLIDPNNALAVAFQTNRGLMIGVSFLILLYGAFMLLLDFDYANNLVHSGFDKKYEWTAALSIMITIIWIYIEVLRILALLRRDS